MRYDRPNGPPHILVTNFSMLEYLLIRPKDQTIFRPSHLYYKDQPRLRVRVSLVRRSQKLGQICFLSRPRWCLRLISRQIPLRP